MRAVTGFTLALGVVLAGAGCSSDDEPAKQPLAATSSPSPSPSPTPPSEHPFTGREGSALKPVLAVKIENTPAGKPQMGLRSADIVYVEQVEGGLTRLMAIFSSKLPAQVGPVRSARISDLHILPMFGKPALGYSGVQTRMIPFVQQASLYDVSDSAVPSAYSRVSGRVAPYNLFASPKKLLAKASKASKAQDVGFTFSDEAPEGGTAKKSFSVKYPAARFTFTWSASQKRWLIAQDGAKDMAAEGGQQGAPTIVVQWVKTDRSQFHDFHGSYTPLVHTVGKGKGVVLRDGKAYDVSWSRSSEEGGTTYTTADGEPMPFSRGQVWVVLASKKPVSP
ncbi:DUF3048 domain-containing protein [Planotetraspora kaengkrachanensis]|uniref:DUF3048 domain-containing protein n=1 Tax=Planotetraspora kaengkrachanensis TaxID=575193 RepID=A0A8J3PZW4_9ACTN|nr:DUF3048 domain-containing protein [Planotetraspora kaengkrachanensis]GIG84174.1 hypothetical protein Pka01_73010 [Planotetraspora kaengkrachanensis]